MKIIVEATPAELAELSLRKEYAKKKLAEKRCMDKELSRAAREKLAPMPNSVDTEMDSLEKVHKWLKRHPMTANILEETKGWEVEAGGQNKGTVRG